MDQSGRQAQQADADLQRADGRLAGIRNRVRFHYFLLCRTFLLAIFASHSARISDQQGLNLLPGQAAARA
jgi:hypothetical protein